MAASTTLTLEERELLLRAEMRLMLKGMDEAANQLSECRRRYGSAAKQLAEIKAGRVA
ncbi:hypothetical protein [Desulfovibrio desulfuricans]|uniref:hypothetical protein n=1 Tax=Desulfovibrio desulfuricans TaxID=876 RepID=UPI001C0350F1|nr:hypothetical protein [Desulfovibrio desulfuricans]MBT9748534.1 hypothetical protein [Desulfovibrio desulfuricans]